MLGLPVEYRICPLQQRHGSQRLDRKCLGTFQGALETPKHLAIPDRVDNLPTRLLAAEASPRRAEKSHAVTQTGTLGQALGKILEVGHLQGYASIPTPLQVAHQALRNSVTKSRRLRSRGGIDEAERAVAAPVAVNGRAYLADLQGEGARVFPLAWDMRLALTLNGAPLSRLVLLVDKLEAW